MQEESQAYSRYQSSFIALLWHGDIPLVQTYWIYGFCVGIGLQIVGALVFYWIGANQANMSSFDTSVFIHGWQLLTITYSVLIIVAVWRSARKYSILNPKKRIYAILAFIACVLASARLIQAVLTVLVGAPAPATSSVHVDPQTLAYVSGLNADLPKKLDSLTTLTRIDFENNSFIYYISTALTINDRQLFVSKMHDQLKSSVCNRSDLKTALKSGIGFKYIYTDATSSQVGSIQISKFDCPNL